MHRYFLTAATILALGLGHSGAAKAQAANTCQGRVVVDTVYQTNAGNNNFEYSIMLRNATRNAVTVDITFSGFPAGVTLFSPILPGIPLSPFSTRSALRFGRGTVNTISVGTVARVYDAGAGTGPTVRVSNCRSAQS